MINKAGKPIARGMRVENNLCKMSVRPQGGAMEDAPPDYTYTNVEVPQDWEMWHKHYRHVGYTGLQKMLDQNLVDRFLVKKTSPKFNCVVCIKAKLTEEPYKDKSRVE